MSAFICSPEHIATLAANYHGKGDAPDEVAATAELLMRANIKSVQYRYSDTAETDLPGPTDTTGVDALVKAVRKLTKSAVFAALARGTAPVEILKLAQSLDYQSCETPEWEDNGPCPAKRALNQIVSNAVGNLPGYDAANWSI